MLRIVMITPQWLGTKGGPTNYVKNLKIQLEAEGHEVFVIASDGQLGRDRISSRPGPREVQLLMRLRKISPDIIHIHGRLHGIPPALVYKHLCKRRTRIVFTFHTQPHTRDYLSEGRSKGELYAGWAGRIGCLLLNRCDVVASVSDSIMKNLREHCSMRIENYRVVQSGSQEMACDRKACEEFRRLNLPAWRTPILCSVGVLSWDWKVAGHKICIGALKLLQERYPRVTLLIVGDGPYRGYLAEVAASLGVTDNVVFCGNMADPSVALCLADVYVHMALNEGSPLAVIEAMMAKKAIIAANQGGIPEIIKDGETGLLIEPSAANLANTLVDLLEDEERCRRLGMNAYAYATQNLSWGKVADRYLSLYLQDGAR